MVLALAGCALTQSQSFYASDRIAELSTALRQLDLDTADGLIARHDDVLSPGKALDIGIRQGSPQVVDHYLRGTDVNRAVDIDGVTPLIRAVQAAPERQREPIVRRLLRAGADPRRTDNFGRSAIDYANFSGNPALAAFLESDGTAFYRSGPARHTEWLPELPWQESRGRSTRALAGVMRQPPFRLSQTGRPDRLFATTWLPEVEPGGSRAGGGAEDAGPFAGLRFHADGTGELMRFHPQRGRVEPAAPAYVAWRLQGQQLRFLALTEQYASYCESIGQSAGRFGVSCTDYSTAGGNLAAVLGDGLSNESARSLLTNLVQRERLAEVGKTRSVLSAALDRYCKPTRAGAALRDGLPANAADAQAPGNWVVFDAARFAAWVSSESACTQRDARASALRECRQSGGRCRSVGGCTGTDATAVASVQGHDWAILSCNADPEAAKQEALAQCRARAGCDCQIVATVGNRPTPRPQACRR